MTMENTPPKTSQADLPKDNEHGINISASLAGSDNQSILIRGKFRVPYKKNGITAQGAAVLKHIVLVVMRSGNHRALAPFRDVVVFEDDIRDEGNSCSGFFNINVMDHISFQGKGGSDYYILCSLGTYLSNTLKVTVP